MFTSRAFLINLFVLVVALVGCNPDDNQPSAVSDCDCPRLGAELKSAKAEISVLKAQVASAAVASEEDERNCTAEFAQAKDKAGLERYNQFKAEHDKKIAAVKAEVSKTEEEAKKLSEPPATLGTPPTVSDYLDSLLVLVPYFDKRLKQCQVDHKNVSQDPITHLDWRYVAVRSLAAWENQIHNQYGDLRNSSDEFRTDMVAAFFFVERGEVLAGGNSEERRSDADRIISVLAEGGSAMQWVVGVVMRLQPQDLAFSGKQVSRLFAATKHDFAKLDKAVLAAEAKVLADHPKADSYELALALPVDYSFGVGATREDAYYQGLVLRYWRYKEAQGKGNGNSAVAKLQKVLRGVAKGMSIDLK